MPAFTNTIDDFEFEGLYGRLNPKAEQLEVIVRPGHAGESTRRTGIRGAPSQIVTMHFVADWEAARNAIDAYIDLIDGNPYQVIQNDVDYGLFKVLNVVEMPQTHACTRVNGSIIPNPQVQQWCQWTLIGTEA